MNESDDVQPDPDQNLDLERLADVCSVGGVAIPDDLSEFETRQLYLLIAHRRRTRLIDFFARSIADDIRKEHNSKGAFNAQKKIRL